MTERYDCDRVDERLEAYLDGDLPFDEADGVALHLQECGHCRRALALADRIRATLRETGAPACPAEVADGIERLPEARGWRWAPVSLAGGLAAGLLAVALVWQGGPDPGRPSQRELAEARQDLELALGYIAKAGRMAGRDVGTVMTRAGVVDPIRSGMSLELPLPLPERKRFERAES